MAIRYSSGFGKLYDKQLNQIVADVRYKLTETDATKYTNKKWWGEFSANQKMKRDDNYIIIFEDGRKGGCWIAPNTERVRGRSTSVYYYRYFGRGKLGKHISIGGQIS